MKPNLLCVSDDPSISDMIIYLGRRSSFNTRATRTQTFANTYQEFRPQAVLLDIFKFEEDGIGLLQQLGQHKSTAQLILISSAQDNYRIRANRIIRKMDLILDAHLYKPFTPVLLQEILYELYLKLDAQQHRIAVSDNA